MTADWVIGIALAAFWFGFALASIFAISERQSDREDKEAEK